MLNVKIPIDVQVSPEHGKPVKYSTYTNDFYDEEGNAWELDDVVPNRVWNRVATWFRLNFPKGD